MVQEKKGVQIDMKEKLNINKLIEKVETPAIRNLEWYYHSLIKIGHSETLSMNDESLISILDSVKSFMKN